jgi:hypothetical protein
VYGRALPDHTMQFRQRYAPSELHLDGVDGTLPLALQPPDSSPLTSWVTI